jgi:hypothetical protein
MNEVITILFTNQLPVTLVILGVICVAIAIIGQIPSVKLQGPRAYALGGFGALLILVAIGVSVVLASSTSTSSTDGATLTPKQECFDNLLESNCSILLPISKGDGQITPPRIASGNLEFSFSNGPGQEEYTGIVFQFALALDVQQFTHLDISGTATQDFKVTIEYKVLEDSGAAKVVKSSEFHSFVAATDVSTVQIPLKFDGKVDEIALMFYVPDEASDVTIKAISLK